MSVVAALVVLSTAVAEVPEPVAAAFSLRAPETPLGELLKALTDPLVGRPYGDSPLGEGEGVDTDPRLRWDTFDCLTFVETAMALATAPKLDGLTEALDEVRYAATPPSFTNRNHFMEAQWIPNNLLRGRIRDLSREIAGDAVVTAKKVYGPERWEKRKKLGDMPLDAEDVPRGTFSVSMVPLEVARKKASSIPAGALVFVVRRDFFTQPTRITHVGLVVETKRGKMLRHASRRPYGRVVDEELAHFFQRNSNYKKWPVEGFAIFEIRPPQEPQPVVTGG